MLNSQERVRVLTWSDIRKAVSQVNQDFAEHVNALNPGKNFQVLCARYYYGESILENGVLQVPGKFGLKPLSESGLSKQLIDDLSYSHIPMGLALNNSVELFLDTGMNPVPFSLINAGKIFALWTVLDTQASAHNGPIWNMTAGARSLFLLPKISDAIKFRRLAKEFSLLSNAPKEHADHFHVFKELSNRVSSKDRWFTDIVFFTHDWLAANTTASKLFSLYLHERVFHSTAYLRNEIVFKHVLSCAIRDTFQKPSPFVVDTIEHLIAIGNGFYPGFNFVDQEYAGPLGMLEETFGELYNMRYAPTFMCPAYFNQQANKTCYYSLQKPTLVSFSPKSNQSHTGLDTLKEVQHIMAKIKPKVASNTYLPQSGPILRWANTTAYDYYHATLPVNRDSDANAIHSIGHLLENDSSLKNIMSYYPDKEFCYSGSFLRGCIKIRPN